MRKYLLLLAALITIFTFSGCEKHSDGDREEILVNINGKWDIYYENGIQKLMTSRDKIQELLNRFMNARESPRDNPDEINSFHKFPFLSQNVKKEGL